MKRQLMNFYCTTAMPVPSAEGEVMFSAEETDFGEIYALFEKRQ